MTSSAPAGCESAAGAQSRGALRVLHVVGRASAAPPGETLAAVERIAREQRRRGDEADVLAVGETGADSRALLAPGAVDVFHVHGLPPALADVRHAARQRQVPYVVHLHGGELDASAPGLGRARPARETRWGRLKFAFAGEDDRSPLCDAAVVLAHSRADRDRALAEAPERRIELIPAGVDAASLRAGDRFRARARLGIERNVPVLLTVAAIGPPQNQGALIDVLSAAPAAHAIVAGPVDDADYDCKVRIRSRAHGVEGRMHVVAADVLEGGGLADVLAAADVFVLPFRAGAPAGAVLEAWAGRVPVVLTRPANAAGLVVDRDTGLVVEAGDLKALAAAVARVLGDETLRGGLTGRAARLVAVRHDWPAVAARLDVLYREAGAGLPRA